MNLNSIIFKGTPEGILIVLDEEINFLDLKEILIKKLKDSTSFFKEATASVMFKGRVLSEDEEIELIKIVSKYSGLDISCFKDSKIKLENSFKNKASETKTIEQNSQIVPNLQENIFIPTDNTYYYRGSIRGGQCLTHSGSIVIIGDVNPGSKIIAEDNIIILGKLKGIVHAGCKGNKKAFISALFMNPTQLIINDIITYFPDDIKREMVPEYAYIKDGKIFVEQLIKI